MVNSEEYCSLKCVEFIFKSDTDKSVKHKTCVDVCLANKENEPTPIGCFNDKADRDLREILGTDMTIEECIKRGQDEDMLYVGLQHGNECWGDTNLGGYGKADDSECHMPCSRDNFKFCGGGYRNLVYDLGDLNRASQKTAAKVADKCKADGKSDFVDCQRLGGYDRADPCKQTCLSDKPVDEE